MKGIFFLFVLLLSFGRSHIVEAKLNASDEQNIVLLDQYYRTANYKYGLSRAKEFSRLILKREGANSPYIVALKSYEALYYISLSELSEYDQALKEARQLFETVDQSDIIAYSLATKALSESYAIVGNYEEAAKVLNSIFYLPQFKQKTAYNPYRMDIVYSQLYVAFQQGYLNSTQTACNKAISEAFNKIISYDSIPDKKGVIRFSKLKKTQLQLRQKQYAALSLLKAEIFLKNGYADSALVLLDNMAVWIKKNLHYKDGLLAQAYYLQSFVYEDRDELNKVVKLLKESSGLALGYYKPHAPQVVAIKKKYIHALIDLNKREEATIINNDLDVKVLSYYGKKSLAYENNKLIDVEREIRNHEWPKVVKHLEAYLDNKDFLPAYSKNRADVLTLISEAYLNLDQLEKAEGAMVSATEIYKQLYGVDAPIYHTSLLNLASFYTDYSEKFSQAELIYDTSFDSIITKEMSHYSSYFNIHKYGEARLMEVIENYAKADLLYQSIEKDALMKSGEASINYAMALNSYANFLLTVGKYGEAEERIKKAMAILDKNTLQKHYIDQAHVLQTQGRYFIILGLYDEADDVFHKVKRLLKKSFETEERLYASLEELYLLNIYMGKYQETEKALQHVVDMREQRFGKIHQSLINPLCYLAYQKIVTGNYAEAESYLEKAEVISAKLFGSSSVRYADVLVYKKQFYTAIGDYEQAEKTIKKAVDIYIQHFGVDHIKVAKYMHELALAKYYTQMDDVKKPLIVNTSKENSKGQTRGLEGLGNKVTSKKDFNTNTDSESLFNKSLAILKQELGEQNPEYALALQNAAVYYMYTGNYDLAIEYSNKSKVIWVSVLGEKNAYAARVDYLLGNILFFQAKYPQSIVSLEKSRDVFKEVFDDMHPEYLEAQGKCAQLYYIQGNVKQSIEASEETIDKSFVYLDQIFPTLSERGKANYWEKVKTNFEFYKTLAFTQNATYPNMIGKVYDITLKTKAILLSSSLKIKQRIQSSGDTVMIHNYNEWIALKEELGVAISMSAAQRKSNDIDIDKLEIQIESYEKKLSRSSDLFAKNFSNKSKFDWETLKKSLNKEELAIEVVPFRYFNKKFTDTIWYAVLSVDVNTKNNPEFVLMKNGLHMNTKGMHYYRNCIKYEIVDEHSYNTYWLPIKPLIKNDKSRIYFSADGVYNQLNIETIRTPENHFLLTENNIVLISSTRDIIERQLEPNKNSDKSEKVNNIVLLGNPLYYSDTTLSARHLVPQLPGAEREVMQLDSLMLKEHRKVTTYLGEKATEEQLKKTYSPGVFHIATHGFFLNENQSEGLDEFSDKAVENPLLRSGLLLKNGGQLLQNEKVYAFNKEDGILTAYEAMNLNFDRTELVVLSACETGLGEVQMGEGVFGLQRSFLVAGSKSVVMSLFKVSDKVTAELMTLFYQKWIESGNKRQSFVDAKIDIMNTYNNPHYWGSFVMMGLE